MKPERDHTKKARGHLSRMGYRAGGHVKGEKDEVVKGVHAHETRLHKGEKKTPAKKLKDGGVAMGTEPKVRADRLRRGGKAKVGKGGKSHVTVNVVNAHPAQPKPVPVPVPVPAGGPGGPPPPGAMAGPPGGPMPPDQGPPPGMNRGGKVKSAKMGSQRNEKPGMPDGHFRKGGRTKPVHMTAGAGSGEGRLEKTKAEARR